MFAVPGKKVIALAILSGGGCLYAPAQINNSGYDNKILHFGITLGMNASGFRALRYDNDTVFVVEPSRGPGFNLGIISDLKIGKHFDIRFIPNLSFAEKHLNYSLFNDSSVIKAVESTNIEFPLTVKFKSDRIENFRVYAIGGVKYIMDLASNAEARNAPDQVKISKKDLAAEYGVGFDFYFPMFKFSIEGKWSNGIPDIHVRDELLIYSRVLEKLQSRTFLISLHFE